MAIRLKVQQGGSARLTVSGGEAVRFKVGQSGAILPPTYDGAYEVTPTEEEQILATAQKIMARNVTVAPIPSNYGRITYNGTTITVS